MDKQNVSKEVQNLQIDKTKSNTKKRKRTASSMAVSNWSASAPSGAEAYQISTAEDCPAQGLNSLQGIANTIRDTKTTPTREESDEANSGDDSASQESTGTSAEAQAKSVPISGSFIPDSNFERHKPVNTRSSGRQNVESQALPSQSQSKKRGRMDKAKANLFVDQNVRGAKRHRETTNRNRSSSEDEEQEDSQESENKEEEATWEEIDVNRPVVRNDEGILTAHLRARAKAKSNNNPRQ